MANIGSTAGRAAASDAPIHPISLTARLCKAIRPAIPGSSFEVGKLALQRAQNVAARLQAISVNSEEDEYRDLLNALEGHKDSPEPDIGVPQLLQQAAGHQPEQIFGFTAGSTAGGPVQDLEEPIAIPAQAENELFWDPNLAFTNLDAWLSALDGDVGSYSF